MKDQSPRSKSISTRALAPASLLVAGMFVTDTAWADNLGGLVFLVFIWPAGLLCCIVLGILTVITIVKKGKGDAARRPVAFFTVSMIVSAAILLIFPVFAILLENAYTANASPATMLISIAPVEIIAATCLVLNRKALRAARGPV